MNTITHSPPPPRRAPGFRMSVVDGVILATGVVAGWVLWRWVGSLAALTPIVVAHFFLFCNVFRVRRAYELLWAAAFVLNFAAWIAGGAFSWPIVLLTQTPLTALLIGAEIASPRYHGIGWGWFNKRRMAAASGQGASDDTHY